MLTLPHSNSWWLQPCHSLGRSVSTAQPPCWCTLQASTELPRLQTHTQHVRCRRAHGLYLQRMVASDSSLAASLAQPAPSEATLAMPPQAPELFKTIKAPSHSFCQAAQAADRCLCVAAGPAAYICSAWWPATRAWQHL